MVIRPRVVPYSIVYEPVGIASSFGAEFPYGPVLVVLGVEELDKAIEGVAIGALRVGLRRARTASHVSTSAAVELVRTRAQSRVDMSLLASYVAMILSVT